MHAKVDLRESRSCEDKTFLKIFYIPATVLIFLNIKFILNNVLFCA